MTSLKEMWGTLTKALLPNENEGEGASKSGGEGSKRGKMKKKGYRQEVLDRLEEHFLEEMANETTTESLLYHTSYTLYVREVDYERLSPSFAQTVRDAVNVFNKHLREEIKSYRGYQNHSKYWEMQLVAIPEDAQMDGVDLSEDTIIIKSKLYADNGYTNDDARMQGDARCVTTIHTKDSSKQMPNAFNLAALKGLTELAKDKYQIQFSLNEITEDPMSEADKPAKAAKIDSYAQLQMEEGDFIVGSRKYRVFLMTRNKLLVSGRNGSAAQNGEDEIHIDDVNVLNPALEITRNPDTKAFSVKGWGEVTLGGKTLKPNTEVPLAPNSIIRINGDYQIKFVVQK